MKRLALAVILSSLVLSGAVAADQTCKAQADAKKLAGAALTSFMKKCESDSQAACDKKAADKKLSGAAKDSFTKKCVTDATGA
jgi:outer membrane murein-binding lipoprotein Lpp